MALLVVLTGCSGTEFDDFKKSTEAFFDSFGEPENSAKRTAPKKVVAKKPKKRTAAKPKTPQVASIPTVKGRPSGSTGEPPMAAAIPDKATLTPALGHPPTQTVTPTSPADPPPQKADPSKLVGLDESQVVRLLGQPEEVHSKPPGTVWSYNANGCSLDVFFYLDIASERFRVLAYEVNSTQVTQEMKKVCLGRIQSAFRAE